MADVPTPRRTRSPNCAGCSECCAPTRARAAARTRRDRRPRRDHSSGGCRRSVRAHGPGRTGRRRRRAHRVPRRARSADERGEARRAVYCRVEVALGDDALLVSVSDDGAGPSAPTAGTASSECASGWPSSADRSRPEHGRVGGFEVRARLPLTARSARQCRHDNPRRGRRRPGTRTQRLLDDPRRATRHRSRRRSGRRRGSGRRSRGASGPTSCSWTCACRGMDGIEATRLLAGHGVEDPVKVVILTTFDLDEYVFDALQAGASGFLLKDSDAKTSSTPCGWWRPATRCSRPRSPRRLIEELTPAAPTPASDAADLERLTPREQRGPRAHRTRARTTPRSASTLVVVRSDREDPRRAGTDEARAPRSGARGHLRVRGRTRGSDHGWTDLIPPGSDDIRRPVADDRCMLRRLGSVARRRAPHGHGAWLLVGLLGLVAAGVLFSSLDADLDDPPAFESEQVSRRLDAHRRRAAIDRRHRRRCAGARRDDLRRSRQRRASRPVFTVRATTARATGDRSRVAGLARRRRRRGCRGRGRVDRARHRRTRGARRR